MGVGVLDHSGYLSYKLATDTLTEHYTTTKNNEIIYFKDGTEQRYLNSLLIENTGSALMYIKPVESNYCIVIPAGESRTLDYIKISGIKILGNLGQTLRWSGCFY